MFAHYLVHDSARFIYKVWRRTNYDCRGLIFYFSSRCAKSSFYTWLFLRFLFIKAAIKLLIIFSIAQLIIESLKCQKIMKNANQEHHHMSCFVWPTLKIFSLLSHQTHKRWRSSQLRSWNRLMCDIIILFCLENDFWIELLIIFLSTG